ncbi:MAG: hypothetical protein RR555_05360 [Bacteroidales bacterium]
MIERIIFPDATFRAELQKMGFTLTQDGKDIDTGNPDNQYIFGKTLELDLSGTEITSLVGISRFEKLRHLNCSNNKLAALDLTFCFGLERLDCSNNQLRSLNVIHCTDLSYLDCSNNKLNMLDVHKLTYLNTLKCNGNNLFELILSNCNSLSTLHCFNNKLTALDVTPIRLDKESLLLCGNQKGKEKFILTLNLSQKENWTTNSSQDPLNADILLR